MSDPTPIIDPIRTSSFGLSTHRFREFDAVVGPDVDPKDITNPALWVHVAPQMKPGDEIRVRAEDDSWCARLYVTYAQGTMCRVFPLLVVPMEKVDYDAQAGSNSLFEAKQRGVKKWCVINKQTGEIVQEMIPTQSGAIAWIEQHERALAS